MVPADGDSRVQAAVGKGKNRSRFKIGLRLMLGHLVAFGAVVMLVVREAVDQETGLQIEHFDREAYKRGGAPLPAKLPPPIRITPEQRAELQAEMERSPITTLLGLRSQAKVLELLDAHGQAAAYSVAAAARPARSGQVPAHVQPQAQAMQNLSAATIQGLEALMLSKPLDADAAGPPPPPPLTASPSAVTSAFTSMFTSSPPTPAPAAITQQQQHALDVTAQFQRMHLQMSSLHWQAILLQDFPAGWKAPDAVRLQVVRELLEASANLSVQLLTLYQDHSASIQASFLPPSFDAFLDITASQPAEPFALGQLAGRGANMPPGPNWGKGDLIRGQVRQQWAALMDSTARLGRTQDAQHAAKLIAGAAEQLDKATAAAAGSAAASAAPPTSVPPPTFTFTLTLPLAPVVDTRSLGSQLASDRLAKMYAAEGQWAKSRAHRLNYLRSCIHNLQNKFPQLEQLQRTEEEQLAKQKVKAAEVIAKMPVALQERLTAASTAVLTFFLSAGTEKLHVLFERSQLELSSAWSALSYLEQQQAAEAAEAPGGQGSARGAGAHHAKRALDYASHAVGCAALSERFSCCMLSYLFGSTGHPHSAAWSKVLSHMLAIADADAHADDDADADTDVAAAAAPIPGISFTSPPLFRPSAKLPSYLMSLSPKPLSSVLAHEKQLLSLARRVERRFGWLIGPDMRADTATKRYATARAYAQLAAVLRDQGDAELTAPPRNKSDAEQADIADQFAAKLARLHLEEEDNKQTTATPASK